MRFVLVLRKMLLSLNKKIENAKKIKKMNNYKKTTKELENLFIKNLKFLHEDQKKSL